jgi:hypothetical protein
MEQPVWSQAAYPEASQAATVLILGILGLVLLPLLSPFAWAMGRREKAAIESGLRSPEGLQTARIGTILGAIGTVMLGLGILVAALLLSSIPR